MKLNSHKTQPSICTPFRRPATALAVHRPHELPEIPELSGSSKATLLQKCTPAHFIGNDGNVDSGEDIRRSEPEESPNVTNPPGPIQSLGEQFVRSASRPSDRKSLSSSVLSLPLREIPKRRSSISALSQAFAPSHQAPFEDLGSETPEIQRSAPLTKQTESPIKHALEKGAQSSDSSKISPLRTFVRTTAPMHLLHPESSRSSRFDMSIRLPSPLFVGGGTVEGQIELKIDATSSKKVRSVPLYLSRLSVDVVGVEEVDDGRRWIFLSLATELFDHRHPPPSALVYSRIPEKGSELYWRVKPATVTVPFCLHLPLKLGPPPYRSRQARIRYLLCPSAIIRTAEKCSTIHQTWTIQMLTVHDPEKALASLPCPLLMTDTLSLSHTPVVASVKLTAGLHRQTWVSGGVIFADVHITNNTDKALKKMGLQLEKSTLWFSYPTLGTSERYASHLRLPAKIETEVVNKAIFKAGRGWNRVASQAAEVRTCELEIPKGHVTIGNGRFFEVRYYVKATISVARNKSVSVQLPVTIIHINSLDIVPNSLAQVAASIEAKRSMATTSTKTKIFHQPHTPGQAFAMSRRQPVDQVVNKPGREMIEALKSLAQEVNKPRHCTQGVSRDFKRCSPDNDSDSVHAHIPDQPPACRHHLKPRPSCYHCHLLHTEHSVKMSPQIGPKLPRLQVSTSGLGFSETEFELPPDSPRKVMLSEKERQMIKQQHELRLQRQLSQQKIHNSLPGERDEMIRAGLIGWRNVAAFSSPRPSGTEPRKIMQRWPTRRTSQRYRTGLRTQRSLLPLSFSGENRIKPNVGQLRTSCSDGISTGKAADVSVHENNGLFRREGYQWSSCRPVDNDVFNSSKRSREQSPHDTHK